MQKQTVTLLATPPYSTQHTKALLVAANSSNIFVPIPGRRWSGADEAGEVEEDGGVDGATAGEVAALELALVGLGPAAPQHPRLDRNHRVGPPLDLARLHGLPFARSGGVDDGPLHHGQDVTMDPLLAGCLDDWMWELVTGLDGLRDWSGRSLL